MPATATYTAYPSKADVEAFITGAGITIPAGLDTDYLRFAGIDQFEQETGYRPFLDTASSGSTFRYDPPGPNFKGESRGGGKLLILDRGFTTITSVTVGVTPTSSGQLLVLDTDYRVRPSNAIAEGRPITAIEFMSAQWGRPESIRILGKPGYATAISAEVWQAIRELAASKVLQAIREGLAGMPTEWREADVAEKYDVAILSSYGNSWLCAANRVITRHRFIPVVRA